MKPIRWPQGKRFAFSIFDDTDNATLTNIAPFYELLRSLGMRTTKSVWPLASIQPNRHDGRTCDDDDYLAWLQQLQRDGFEIAFHMARAHSSVRADTIRALDRFRECFGHDPRSMANHSRNQENIYWGDRRLSGLRRTLFQLLTMARPQRKFSGDLEGDEYFWGDICRDRISYVRSFTFRRLHQLPMGPPLPYVDPQRPFVASWFTGVHTPDVHSFLRLMDERQQAQLESEQGLAILYTHVASGFVTDGNVEPAVRSALERMSQRDGWFAPVSTIMDYLVEYQGLHTLTDTERSQLEWTWLCDQIRR